MGKKVQSGVRTDVAAHSDLMRGLMTSVVAFMARTGMSNAEIDRVFQSCVSDRMGRSKKLATTRTEVVAYGCDTVAGAVLRAWHRLPRYLDDSARPIPLSTVGPGATLSSLIRSQRRKANPEDVIKSMVNAGLLRSCGPDSYMPAKDSATIETLDPLSVDHIAKTIMRLVETASRNTAESKNKLSLIERYAHVPDLTKSEARAFAAFSRQQGQACLDAIEDWLESRQVNSVAQESMQSRGVNAGVHIFAYLGESGAINQKAPRSKAKKRSTPAREARV